MKSTVLKNKVKKLIAVFSVLIVISYPIYSQNATNKDSLVVISKVTAQNILIELKECDNVKKINALYAVTDSTQNAIIKNDSLQIGLYKQSIKLTDSLYRNCKKIADNNLSMYKIADAEVSKQKRIQKVSWIVSGILAILLIIK